jgi:hypothetical protein
MELERLKFMSKVNNVSGRKVKDLSECWLWRGAPDKRDGYCRFQTDWAKANGVTYAHQASYKLFKDSDYSPSRERPCSHMCEATDDYLHRTCVNPDHLYIANSIAENMADRDANRGSYQSTKTAGLKSGSSIFTQEQLDMIRQHRAEGKSYQAIATELGCNRRTIERICLGRTYKND